MIKETGKKKDKRGYVSWGIMMVFCLQMAMMSASGSWGGGITAFFVLTMVIVSVATFHEQVSARLQTYIIAIAAMGNTFVYSYVQQELYSSLLVVTTVVILMLAYQDFMTILIVSVMSILMVVIHTVFLHTVPLETSEDVTTFVLRVFELMVSEVFLLFFVHRLCSVEKSLKASVEEARNAERSKSDFLANMSHEIRTPMNAIIGMCELVLREEINDNVRENCFNIQNSGRSLLAIINDILDFSKIESGKIELIETEFNIGSTINDAINMAMTRKGDKKLEIIARIDPTIPKGLIGDEVRIKQIMVNLVTNAVKFTSAGCVVLEVTQSKHDYGINLNVSVKDSGIGITEENLEKLFTSFQQVDTRKKRSVEGTGLGLAISKRLVAKMGGFINVSSTYGEGSEFKFVIPLKVSAPQPFVALKNPNAVNVAVYIDLHKYSHPKIEGEYRKLIHELGNNFKIGFKLFDTMEELKKGIKTDEYTHCIIAREEYMAGETFFNKIADDIDLLVIQDRVDSIKLPGSIRCIYKPFYALSVAAVLNNENFIFNLNHQNSSNVRFTAPEAKVLIVDDNITNLKVAEGLMKPYNMRIITVMSGLEAIKALKTQDYDLVFMDHMMPEMDGVEATKFIRGMEGDYYKKLPIIALTANAINGVKEMFLREGFNDFIAKPIELSLLDRVLKAWLPKERMVSISYDVQVEKKQTDKRESEEGFVSTHIQFDKGMVYAGGNKDVYLEVVKVYTQNGWKQKESIDKHFKDEDWTNYVIEVHALKSSSLSVGAQKLSELAKTLEFAGKEGNYDLIREKHGKLSNMHAEVLSDTEKYLKVNGISLQEEREADEEQILREITMEEFSDSIERIKNACENFDGDEIISIVDEMCACSLNGKSLKPYLVEVKKLADDFEYEQAKEVAMKAAADVANL